MILIPTSCSKKTYKKSGDDTEDGGGTYAQFVQSMTPQNHVLSKSFSQWRRPCNEKKNDGNTCFDRDLAMIGNQYSGPPLMRQWRIVANKKQGQKVISDHKLEEAAEFIDHKYGKDEGTVEFETFPTDPSRNIKSLINCRIPNLMELDHHVQTGNHICGITYKTCGNKNCVADGGCKTKVAVNDLVYLQGADTHRLSVGLYCVAAYKVEKGHELGCRVGYVKALYCDLPIITNRMAQVSKVIERGGNGKDSQWVRWVGGIAEFFYVDRGVVHHLAPHFYKSHRASARSKDVVETSSTK